LHEQECAIRKVPGLQRHRLMLVAAVSAEIPRSTRRWRVGFGGSPKHIFEMERVGTDTCRSVAGLFCAFGDVVSHRLRRSQSTFRIHVERVVLNALLTGGDITGTA
jgi:hypothetical protein